MLISILFLGLSGFFDAVIQQLFSTNYVFIQLFEEGFSKLQYPKGKHNQYPSLAVDVAPYPIDWKDRERFTYFAGFVMGIAASMGLTIRWGGDWDRDTELKDNNFDDLPHFEIKD